MSDLLPPATQVAVDGVRFSLHRAEPSRPGRTTPVLLLHGIPETAATWAHLLSELAWDRVVLAPDLKGLGGSEAIGSYDVPSLVAELAALVLHEVDGPVDVVGHDWGGVLAIGLAALRPELVRRLVVVNAPYRKIDYVRAVHVALSAVPLVPELALRALGPSWVRMAFGLTWTSQPPPDSALLEHYAQAYADPQRIGAMLSYYRAEVRGRIGSGLAGLVELVELAGLSGLPGLAGLRGDSSEQDYTRLPVGAEKQLVVWGVDDPVLPMSVGEAVVRDLGADTSMVTVPGVGHFPHEEAPEVVTPVIAGFLREGERKPRARKPGERKAGEPAGAHPEPPPTPAG